MIFKRITYSHTLELLPHRTRQTCSVVMDSRLHRTDWSIGRCGSGYNNSPCDQSVSLITLLIYHLQVYIALDSLQSIAVS